jgi:hypothetical protein
VDEVAVVVAHHERATLRVGEVFLKIDVDQRNTDVEVEALALAPIPTPQVVGNRELAGAALRPWSSAFIHGDLQVAHVFIENDDVTGVIDWSEAAQGDALYDLAILTLGHQGHLQDVLDGYGRDVNIDVIRGWWSVKSLAAVRWLVEHGFDPSAPGCEVDVLKAQLQT